MDQVGFSWSHKYSSKHRFAENGNRSSSLNNYEHFGELVLSAYSCLVFLPANPLSSEPWTCLQYAPPMAKTSKVELSHCHYPQQNTINKPLSNTEILSSHVKSLSSNNIKHSWSHKQKPYSSLSHFRITKSFRYVHICTDKGDLRKTKVLTMVNHDSWWTVWW